MSANRQRSLATVRNWNEVFPPGTRVLYEGTETVTDTWAALNYRGEVAVVFIRGVEEPVPLERLTVPGWERTNKRR